MSYLPGHYPSPTTSPAPSLSIAARMGSLYQPIPAYTPAGNDPGDLIKLDPQDFFESENPVGSAITVSPTSPEARMKGPPPFAEDDDVEDAVSEQREPSPPPRSPTPAHDPHPEYYFEDAQVNKIMYRLHPYLVLQDETSVFRKMIEESGECSARRPLELPSNVKQPAFDSVLKLLYRPPLQFERIDIKTLKDACIASEALGLTTLHNAIGRYIVEHDSQDEDITHGIAKYLLATKFPDVFTKRFRTTQIDKICLSTECMTQSHMVELGFTDLPRFWKATLAARIGYDGSKKETFQPDPDPPRRSYMFKTKDKDGYRLAVNEFFAI